MVRPLKKAPIQRRRIMKKLSAIITLLIGLFVFAQRGNAADPQNFTGTWEGPLSWTWDLAKADSIHFTLKIGCTNSGQLTAEADVYDGYQNSDARGEINRIVVKEDEVFMIMAYRAKDTPGRMKTLKDGHKIMYTLKLSGEMLSGYGKSPFTGSQFTMTLKRANATIACAATTLPVG